MLSSYGHVLFNYLRVLLEIKKISFVGTKIKIH